VVVLLVVVIACVLAYVIVVVDDDAEMDSEVACFINYCISILGQWSGVVERLEIADIHLDWLVSSRSEWSGDFAGVVARSGIAGKCHAMRLPTIEMCRNPQRISWCTVANMSSHFHWVCTCAYGDLDVWNVLVDCSAGAKLVKYHTTVLQVLAAPLCGMAAREVPYRR
jgi:hypothetical protein